MQEQQDRIKVQLEAEVKQLAIEFVREQYLEIILYLYVYFLISFYLENFLSIIQLVMCLIFVDICNILNDIIGRSIQTCYCLQTELRVYYYLESFIYCLMKLCYILIVMLEIQFYLMLILFPLLLLILRLLIYCNKKKYFAFVAFQQFFNVLWKIVILVETLSVTLKLDNFVAWDWIQVLWLFLILLILDGVITFVSLLYFIIKVIPALIKKNEKQRTAYYVQFVLYQVTIFMTNLFLYFNNFALKIILPILFILMSAYTYFERRNLEQYYANFIFNLEIGRDLEEKQQPYEQATTILQRVSTNYYKPIMTNVGQRQSSQPPMLSNDLQSVNSEEQNLCVICQDKVGEKIFMPCGHGKFCAQCIGNTDACFLCRNEIAQILTVQQDHISFGIVAK